MMSRTLRAWLAMAWTCVALVSMSSSLPAAQAWLRDADQGMRQAQSRQQPLVLFITMHGCSYCQKMIATTFHDPQVLSDLGQQFVPVAVERSERPDIVKRLKIRSFPTTLVIGADGKILERMNGYVDPQTFRQRLAPFAAAEVVTASQSTGTGPMVR